MIVAAATKRQRSETYYNGRVQGVGFRYTTAQLAADFRVTGYVKNLADGGVLLVAEGDADELDRFGKAIETHLGRYIEDRRTHVGEPTGEFDDFGIRY